MHILHHTTCSTYSNVCIYLPINSVCENAVSCRTTTQTNAMFFRSIASVASLYTANCHTVLVMVCVCVCVSLSVPNSICTICGTRNSSPSII